LSSSARAFAAFRSALSIEPFREPIVDRLEEHFCIKGTALIAQ